MSLTTRWLASAVRRLVRDGVSGDPAIRFFVAIEPVRRPTDVAGRLRIVGGTLIPVRERDVGVSSGDYRFSANARGVTDGDTKSVVAAARPTPGNRPPPGFAEDEALGRARRTIDVWNRTPPAFRLKDTGEASGVVR